MWLYGYDPGYYPGGIWYKTSDVIFNVEDSEDVLILNAPRECWRLHARYNQRYLSAEGEKQALVELNFYYEKFTKLLVAEKFTWFVDGDIWWSDSFTLAKSSVYLPVSLAGFLRLFPYVVLIVLGVGVATVHHHRREKQRKKRTYEKAFG
jgi:hypothetical protein